MQLEMPEICDVAELEKCFTDSETGRIYVTAREIREDCRKQCFPNRKKGKSYYLYKEAAIAYYKQKFETFDGHESRPEKQPRPMSQRQKVVANKRLATYEPPTSKKTLSKEAAFKERIAALKRRSAG